MIYTISDFNTIQSDGFNVTLPTNTIELINNLSQHVGSPSYIKTPVFAKKESSSNLDSDKKKRRRYKQHSHPDSNGWCGGEITSKIVFKETSIVKKEGMEMSMQSIRGLLNKVGTTNTASFNDDIFSLFDTIFSSDMSAEEVMQIVTTTIDLLSHDSFYVDIYASLFSILMINIYCLLIYSRNRWITTLKHLIILSVSIQTMTMIYFVVVTNQMRLEGLEVDFIQSCVF